MLFYYKLIFEFIPYQLMAVSELDRDSEKKLEKFNVAKSLFVWRDRPFAVSY